MNTLTQKDTDKYLLSVVACYAGLGLYEWVEPIEGNETAPGYWNSLVGHWNPLFYFAQAAELIVRCQLTVEVVAGVVFVRKSCTNFSIKVPTADHGNDTFKALQWGVVHLIANLALLPKPLPYRVLKGLDK